MKTIRQEALARRNAEIRAKDKSGVPRATLAAEYELAPAYIFQICGPRGVGVYHPALDDAERQKRKEAAALVADGATYQEAADALGISRNAVAGACKRAGVRVGHRPEAVRRARVKGARLRWQRVRDGAARHGA